MLFEEYNPGLRLWVSFFMRVGCYLHNWIVNSIRLKAVLLLMLSGTGLNRWKQ